MLLKKVWRVLKDFLDLSRKDTLDQLRKVFDECEVRQIVCVCTFYKASFSSLWKYDFEERTTCMA